MLYDYTTSQSAGRARGSSWCWTPSAGMYSFPIPIYVFYSYSPTIYMSFNHTLLLYICLLIIPSYYLTVFFIKPYSTYRYVRFISHEIRTPLNTVKFALKVFDLELLASLKVGSVYCVL
jgi:hypothetical protein